VPQHPAVEHPAVETFVKGKCHATMIDRHGVERDVLAIPILYARPPHNTLTLGDGCRFQ